METNIQDNVQNSFSAAGFAQEHPLARDVLKQRPEWLAAAGALAGQAPAQLPKPVVQGIKALHTVKGRQETGLILAEGHNALQEAFNSGFSPLFWIVDASRKDDYRTLERVSSQDFSGQHFSGQHFSRPILLGGEQLARLTTTESSPGCLAIFERPEALPLEAFLQGKQSLLVLAGLQDPGNAGTLIRSARAFGFDGLVTTPGTVDVWSPKVIRSSAGLVFGVPACPCSESLETILEWVVTQGVSVCLTSSHVQPQSQPYTAFSWPARCALVLGNEGAGLPVARMPAQTQWITIPTEAACESLNVAVAGSILMAARYNAVSSNTGSSSRL
ncbi:MAG: RNA methyltransferase [Vampirovibrionales bacterium]|nr:RNA methyltransferase [Vampirovibrionales bacterium]